MEKISKIPFLTSIEAEERLREDGFNELPAQRGHSLFSMLLDTLREPMIFLLLFGCVLYLFLGDKPSAVLLFVFVFFVIGITCYQEGKAERALTALRNLSSPRALVIRDGKEQRIAGREVVCGDLIVVREGDSVPADAHLLDSDNLFIDESLLTGESFPAIKGMHTGEVSNIYSGTLVVSGYGVAQVYAVGRNAAMGKIGRMLDETATEKTPLQIETRHLVRNFAFLGLLVCVLIIVVFGATRHDWLNGLLAGLTLAMSILPEEFPVVLSSFLALGAWRISKWQVLTRRVPVLEALGAATVLCVDKTGTLTRNQMRVEELYAHGDFFNLSKHDYSSNNPDSFPEKFHELVEFSILASQRDPFDPMERAIKELGKVYLSNTEHLHDDWDLVRQYPLSEKLLSISHVWQSPNGMDYVIAAKGAPEAIVDLCHMKVTEVSDIMRQVSTIASKGMRVLGVAKASFHKAELPSEQHDFTFEFLGLIGLHDPLRKGVKEALQECYAAGIRVIILTGDYPETAKCIAEQIELESEAGFITGTELAAMDNLKLRERIRHINIFARIMPEQKLRLVEALRANGEIVAMTGDGVNDAPALKAAHIGIAMGQRGTDVAREAAALVLLKDDFNAIVTAVKLGRRIFANIRKAVAYILAVHIPIAGMSLLPVLLKLPLILLPIHIVFLELIINPACSIVFEAEPEEGRLMRLPPRNPKEPLFSKILVWLGVFQGMIALVVVVATFFVARTFDQNDVEVRGLTFTVLVVTNICLILTNRSWSLNLFKSLLVPNRAFWIVIVGTLVLLGLIFSFPFLRNLFHFGILNTFNLILCICAGLLSLLGFELVKLKLGRRFAPGAGKNYV